MIKQWAHRLEWTLLGAGLGCLGIVGYVSLDAERFQHAQVAAFEATRPAPPLETTSVEAGGLIGLLSVPVVGIATAVIEGDDDASLRRAAGHLPDTPLPWEDGNSAIAAHRDGRFRALRNVRVGDEIRWRTRHGEMLYEVRELSIVDPTDLSVLAPGERASLTLITCYPFYYVGNAPKRFIVRADRVTSFTSGAPGLR